MQEVIGTSIALYILSLKTIPLWAGCLITIADTFTFLLLDRYGLRKLEFFFAFLIAVMAVSFGYNYFYDLPDQGQVFKNIFVPGCKDCGNEELLQAVASIGAVIMPHNLYLHSALVKTRKINRRSKKSVKEANKYFFIEGAIALLISFIISTMVISVFAHNMYEVDYATAYNACDTAGSIYIDAFEVEPSEAYEFIDADLYVAGAFLGCTFGIACTYIWAVGILASGQSSTMTGTYAGQFAMEGFLNLRWKRWQRVLLTRTIAIGPTFAVAYFTDIHDMTTMNDILNTVMSIQLPFAVLPALTFSSSRAVMGSFANGVVSKILHTTGAIIIMGVNVFFVIQFIGTLPSEWWVYLLVGLFSVYYIGFVAYLTVFMMISFGWESLAENSLIQRLYRVDKILDLRHGGKVRVEEMREIADGEKIG